MQASEPWPDLPPLESWQDCCATLHLWTQVVGKVRLALAPMVNHWWQVPLYVTSRGLTTSPIPYQHRTFQIDFDFVDHVLRIDDSDGRRETIALAPISVAEFYHLVLARLRRLGIDLHIWTMPVEIKDAIPFEQDTAHAAYDPDMVQRFWRALLQADRLLARFRSKFLGKVSPVHFFWGSFDLAVTRFSGRTAPAHPGGVPNLGDWVAQEAYSHEVSSAGFWPGNGGFGRAAFYAYAYPTPIGFGDVLLRADGAYYDQALGEFILPYDLVRRANDPDALVLEFLECSYAAAAELAGWNRLALERTST